MENSKYSWLRLYFLIFSLITRSSTFFFKLKSVFPVKISEAWKSRVFLVVDSRIFLPLHVVPWENLLVFSHGNHVTPSSRLGEQILRHLFFHRRPMTHRWNRKRCNGWKHCCEDWKLHDFLSFQNCFFIRNILIWYSSDWEACFYIQNFLINASTSTKKGTCFSPYV